MKPKLSIERAMDKEIPWNTLPRFPHCDPRVLHKPEECEFCKKANILQEEREKLEVSNTGHANRKWPCPEDQARPSKVINAWSGNRAKTKEGLEKEDKEWKAAMSEWADEESSNPSA